MIVLIRMSGNNNLFCFFVSGYLVNIELLLKFVIWQLEKTCKSICF